VLVSSIALPFFALSASAPILQRWFAGTRHPSAADPYFLYAASNLGSLGGLLAYPVLVEPLLRLGAQSYVWAGGFATLVILMAACAAVMWRSDAAPGAARDAAAGTSAIPWRTRLRWLALAAVPASLLVSVTGWITTDFAIPLLWVVPLAIYLATFVL